MKKHLLCLTLAVIAHAADAEAPIPANADQAAAEITAKTNVWSEPQVITPNKRLNVPSVTVNGPGNGGVATANALFVTNTIAGTPDSIVAALESTTTCHGTNRTFVGCFAGYFSAIDDARVSPTTKGVLYGLGVAVAPAVDRGDNSPNDDVAGVVISNTGRGRGTEAVYLGRNNGISNDWGAGIGIDANALDAIYLTGSYTYGMTFAHGALHAGFHNGGGVMLVPRPATGETPVLSVGTDAFAPENNAIVTAIDSSGAYVISAPIVLRDKPHSASHNDTAIQFGNGASGSFPVSAGGTLIASSPTPTALTAFIDFSAINSPPTSAAINLPAHITEACFGRPGICAGGAILSNTDRDAPQLAFAAGRLEVRWGQTAFSIDRHGVVAMAPTTFATLPGCSAATAGAQAFITDAPEAITAWHQPVNSGGGVHRAFVACNGSGWFAYGG